LNNQESLETEYRLKKKEYEKEGEELIIQRDKAISVVEEVQERSHYYLKKLDNF